MGLHQDPNPNPNPNPHPNRNPNQVSNFEENSGPDFGDFTLTDIAAGLF